MFLHAMIKCKPSVAHCACMVQLIDGLDYESVFFHRPTDWAPRVNNQYGLSHWLVHGLEGFYFLMSEHEQCNFSCVFGTTYMEHIMVELQVIIVTT